MTLWSDFLLREPIWLLWLAVMPFIWLWRRRWRKAGQQDAFPYTLIPQTEKKTWRTRLLHTTPTLFWIAIGLLIVAMARPQKQYMEEKVEGEGIDIFLVMDLSSSMLARDFNPDRLTVSKQVAIDFVSHRHYDRIGLVVFAAESFTQCPLTHDHAVLIDYLNRLECGMLEDGTAIGMGLAAAVNRLQASSAESKVVVLLTDGVNNSGYIRPATAAGLAREFEVKVYTIGVGSYGQAISPVRRRSNGEYVFGLANVEIDEDLLRNIAEQTGGKYYRATSAEALQQVYREIDDLEKTKVEVTVFRRFKELYYYPLLAGFALLTLLVILRNSVVRSLPA